MKILVLMPLDEQHVYAATGIYRLLSKEVQEHCFAMPMFMQYSVTTKLSETWTHAMFETLAAAQNIYKLSEEKNDDLIFIGNIDKSYEFDAVFNFQDMEESLPYEDNFIEKIKSIVADEEVLMKYIKNLHSADESMLSLKNCGATAKFLSDYIKTDPHLEDIITQYKDEFKILEKSLFKKTFIQYDN